MRHFRGHSQVSGETRKGAGFAMRSESSGRIWYLGHQPDTCHFTPTWQRGSDIFDKIRWLKHIRDAEMSEILVAARSWWIHHWLPEKNPIFDDESRLQPCWKKTGHFLLFVFPWLAFYPAKPRQCFQSYYVVCKDRWKLLVLRQIWGFWVFQCQGVLLALVVFQFRNCEALAALADLASSEKGAMVVAEIGALPLCVSLLQSSEEANSLCEACEMRSS